MALVPIFPAGAVGYLPDRPEEFIPAPAWTDMQNIRIDDGVARKVHGYTSSELGVPGGVIPYWMLAFRNRGKQYLIYAGDDTVFAASTEGSVDITPSGINTGTRWNGGSLGGTPVLNNGLNVPYIWSLFSSDNLEPLPAWNYRHSCGVIRPFKNYLVAADVRKKNKVYPQMVKWSHPAEPGFLPSTWDETDLTKLAGEVVLLETPGEVVDMLPLQDRNVIYKSDSVYLMTEIGGQYIFRFDVLFKDIGILAQDCVADIGGRHVLLSQEDIVVHDGSSSQSIVDGRLRRWFFDKINKDHYANSYVFHHSNKSEVWFCIPTDDNRPDLALVWNYTDNTFALRDLPNAFFIQYAINFDPLPDWNTLTDSWDSLEDPWDSEGYSTVVLNPITASEPSPGIAASYVLEDTYQQDGSNYCSFVERRSIPFLGQDSDGNLIANVSRKKVATEVWPYIDVLEGTPSLSIYIGSQEKVAGPVTWEGPFAFDPDADEKVSCLVGGKLLAIRIEDNSNSGWELRGYYIRVKQRGTY